MTHRAAAPIDAACHPARSGQRVLGLEKFSAAYERFVLTPHPDCADVTVASGFSGHGFKFVPVVGEIVAELATTGTTAHPIGLFDPRRLVTS